VGIDRIRVLGIVLAASRAQGIMAPLMDATARQPPEPAAVNMVRRWIGWALATGLALLPFSRWPFALPAILAVTLPLQLVASILVARGLSRRLPGRIGWSIGLLLASVVLSAAALFVWYISFGESLGR
jgi:hypothetical protein